MTVTAEVATRRRPGLATAAGAMATSAVGGAVALATVGIGEHLERRLPFGSPVLGAVALLLVVALPFGALAGWAWRGEPEVDAWSRRIGALLIVWIAVELAFLREVSLLHPLCVLAGSLFVMAGRDANDR